MRLSCSSEALPTLRDVTRLRFVKHNCVDTMSQVGESRVLNLRYQGVQPLEQWIGSADFMMIEKPPMSKLVGPIV